MLQRIKTTLTDVNAPIVQDALGALSLVVLLVAALHLPVLV